MCFVLPKLDYLVVLLTKYCPSGMGYKLERLDSMLSTTTRSVENFPTGISIGDVLSSSLDAKLCWMSPYDSITKYNLFRDVPNQRW